MKHYWIFFIVAISLFSACGHTDEEAKRLSAQEKARIKTEDSLALKVGITPTLDCLPLLVAKDKRIFDTLGVDVRLRYFTAQMDCDTALVGGSVEGSVTDLVRATRLIRRKTPLTFVSRTNLYWQLITNRNARLKEIKQLPDKMVAMTRFSAIDYLTDYALDSAKVSYSTVYRPQINDVFIRLNMLLNNEMDAMFLPEPQATVAMMARHKSLLDSRKLNLFFGAIAFRTNDINKDKRRDQQLKIFLKAYDIAVDSINNYGIEHYSYLVEKYCRVNKDVVKHLPHIVFLYHQPPRLKDVKCAQDWLTRKGIK
jgi:NitT/TauT family transport system substrate-binding protein